MPSRIETLKVLLVCAVLVAGTTLAFWDVKDADFLNYDDPQYVTENLIVQRGLTMENIKWAFTTFHFHNWHPLTWLSYMADYEIFGLNPRGYHLVNLAIHVANTLLLFVLLRRLTGAVWASGIVAGFFGWHPLHVESVAWIAERKDVLSTLFWLLTMWAYAEYAGSAELSRACGTVSPNSVRQPSGETLHPNPSSAIDHAAGRRPCDTVPQARESSALRWYAGMLAFFVLGLMSKAMLVTLPFALLLMDVWPLRRLDVNATQWWSNAPRLLLEKIPLFALAAAVSYAAYAAQAGAVIATGDWTLAERLANAVMSYARYIGKTVWPADLAVFYPPGIWQASHVISVAVILAVVSAAAVLRVKDKPFLFTGWFWFVGTLVPVIGIVQVGSQSMADRYMYVPSIGLFVAIVWSVRDQLRPVASGVATLPAKIAGGMVVTAALVACLVVTARQVEYWKDSITLLTHAERVTPPNIVTLNNLTMALLQEGRTNEANQRVMRSIEVAPLEELTWQNAGNMAFREGRLDEALGYYRKGLELKPNSSKLNFSAGLVLDRLGKSADAIEYYRRAIQLKPDYTEAHRQLGFALEKMGR